MSSYKHGLLTDEETERHKIAAESGSSKGLLFTGAMTIGFMLSLFFNIAQSLTMRDLKATLGSSPAYTAIDMANLTPSATQAVVSGKTVVLQWKRASASPTQASMQIYYSPDQTLQAVMFGTDGTYTNAYTGTWSTNSDAGITMNLFDAVTKESFIAGTYVFTSFFVPNSYAVVKRSDSSLLGVVYSTDILSGNNVCTSVNGTYVAPSNYALAPLSSAQIVSALQEKTISTRMYQGTGVTKVYFSSTNSSLTVKDSVGNIWNGNWTVTTSNGDAAVQVYYNNTMETRLWYNGNGGLFRAYTNGSFIGFAYFIEAFAGKTI